MNSPIKSILFDLDGTLVDSVSWHEEALNRALEEMAGFRIGEWENKETFSGKLTKDKLLLLTQQKRLNTQKIEPIIQAKKKYLSQVIGEKDRKDPDKIDLFSKLSGYNVGCVTNSNSQAALEILTIIGLSDYFDLLITGDDVRYHKPYSEGYVMSMVKLGSIPTETVIVEDSFLGIQAARNTGAHVWEVNSPAEVNWTNLQLFLKEIR